MISERYFEFIIVPDDTDHIFSFECFFFGQIILLSFDNENTFINFLRQNHFSSRKN